MGRKRKDQSSPTPEIEIKLKALQDEYLKTKDITVYQQIFSELLPYARSLTLKSTKNKKYLPPELVDNAALEATVKFMSQYNNADFTGIHSSFGGILRYKVLESLYGPGIIKADSIASLNEHIESSKTLDTELGDMAESFNFSYLFRPDGASITDDPANYLFNTDNDAINNILTVIKDLYMATNLHTYYRVCLGVILQMKHAKTLEKYVSTILDPSQKEIFDLTMLEIFKRLKNVA